MANLLSNAVSSTSGSQPLADLHIAVGTAKDCVQRQLSRSPRLHDFTATDTGVEATGTAAERARSAWQHSRSSALNNSKNSEVTQGLFLPCVTYGKAQFELDQAKKTRTGNLGPANYNACNASCIGYGLLSLAIP
ncbi:hypothetical protein BD289DRAFT_250323 [Coniella lustricola]|uniref:Uncharacterized protein n=1 Tax=Coniella lustricola TaxID=2025994 RepID=A0A2T3A8S9_9PEZI|nr:hypothetical protein BD289DRAFT_250323 [Coniella lustricola]